MAETEALVTAPVEAEAAAAETTTTRKTVVVAVAAPVEAEAAAAEETTTTKKTVVVIGLDDSEHSYYALEWTARNVAAGADLVIVHAKPPASAVISIGGPVAMGEVVQYVDADLRRIADEVVEKARRVCAANSIKGLVEVIEGEPRHALCDAVEKHSADLLVVGSHGYGAIKRAFLGSVSDYCAHHAHCSVMIVKQPKTKK